MLSDEKLDGLAERLYLAECSVMGVEPELGRGGFKTQIVVWRALAREAEKFFAEYQTREVDL